MKPEDFTDEHRTDLLDTMPQVSPRQERKGLEGWNTCAGEGPVGRRPPIHPIPDQ